MCHGFVNVWKSACHKLALITVAMATPVVALPQPPTLKSQLVGAWTVVSVDAAVAGAKRELFGPSPKGFISFDVNGRYSLAIMRQDIPRIASNNREAGTSDENRAIVAGSLAHFGSYTVNEKDRSITFRIEASTFPNWTGAHQERFVTSLSDDELHWINPISTLGLGSSYLVWKRAR